MIEVDASIDPYEQDGWQQGRLVTARKESWLEGIDFTGAGVG